MVNGQEPGTNGILSIYEHGKVYSPILYIIERMKNDYPQLFDYQFDEKKGNWTIHSDSKTIIAIKGRPIY